MIEMKVMGIALDTRTGSPIVVLHDKENRRALPIWIGSAEASAIIRKIENLSVSRPMTHDLIISIIEKTGYNLEKIEINDVEKETYLPVKSINIVMNGETTYKFDFNVDESVFEEPNLSEMYVTMY